MDLKSDYRIRIYENYATNFQGLPKDYNEITDEKLWVDVTTLIECVWL